MGCGRVAPASHKEGWMWDQQFGKGESAIHHLLDPQHAHSIQHNKRKYLCSKYHRQFALRYLKMTGEQPISSAFLRPWGTALWWGVLLIRHETFPTSDSDDTHCDETWRSLTKWAPWGNEAQPKGSEGTEFTHLRLFINVYNPLHQILAIILLRTEVRGVPSVRILDLLASLNSHNAKNDM